MEKFIPYKSNSVRRCNMKKFEFNSKIFNRQAAFPLTVMQYVSITGFIVMAIIVISGPFTDLQIPIPSSIAVFFFISFVVFPIVSVMKIGYKRGLKWSKLSTEANVIIYDKLAERMWTAVGHVEEHHIYTVSKVNSIKLTKRYFLITGEIHKVIINNDRLLEEKETTTVKIPRAYSSMEELDKNG